jgi:hypothetical protein
VIVEMMVWVVALGASVLDRCFGVIGLLQLVWVIVEDDGWCGWFGVAGLVLLRVI